MLPEVYVSVFAVHRYKATTTTKITQNRHFPGKITAHQKPGKKSTVHQNIVAV